ncbi:hypothetical protein PsYK624_117970 [Phanerochaete sordida]|uniref:Uncharacterized protein n=1 Tax=Phanerochaete sordida TaxID=48140 RepID=A0A9P3GIW8_9APHY|nr:hypothetical protein PsYK624_117970 [Phanerochaete sordida]
MGFMCYFIARGAVINCAALFSSPKRSGAVLHAEPWGEIVSQDELQLCRHYAGQVLDANDVVDRILEVGRRLRPQSPTVRSRPRGAPSRSPSSRS